jgi:hypothetical protein
MPQQPVSRQKNEIVIEKFIHPGYTQFTKFPRPYPLYRQTTKIIDKRQENRVGAILQPI